jgi:hypothetical protein
MTMRSSAWVLTLFLTACASHPVPPDWQAGAYSGLRSFTADYLSGNTRMADLEFAKARGELARTGRFERVARAELVRCAVQVAGLEFNECPGFAALAADAGDAERAYAAFLTGKTADAKLLPPHYRAVVEARKEAVSSLEDPLARLIGAGVLMRSGRLLATDIDLAVSTASDQGWRRPLLAWLGVQAEYAERNGDTALATLARRRVELVGGSR